MCKYVYIWQAVDPFIRFSIWGINHCFGGLELELEDTITVFISSMSQEYFR